MRWALQWLLGWLLALWTVREVLARPPPPPAQPPPPPSQSTPQGAHHPSVPALDAERLHALLQASPKPGPQQLRARELAPDVYEVTVPDAWPADFVRCGRIVPAFRNGHPYGFKVFALSPEYQQLGLRNGDTLLHVNGVALANRDAGIELYANAAHARRIELGLERDGHLLTRTYVLDRTLAEATRAQQDAQ